MSQSRKGPDMTPLELSSSAAAEQLRIHQGGRFPTCFMALAFVSRRRGEDLFVFPTTAEPIISTFRHCSLREFVL